MLRIFFCFFTWELFLVVQGASWYGMLGIKAKLIWYKENALPAELSLKAPLLTFKVYTVNFNFAFFYILLPMSDVTCSKCLPLGFCFFHMLWNVIFHNVLRNTLWNILDSQHVMVHPLPPVALKLSHNSTQSNHKLFPKLEKYFVMNHFADFHKN